MKNDVTLSQTELHQFHLHSSHLHTNLLSHELHRLDRLKEDFLSTISHELRTPLSSMYLSIQLLEMLLINDQDSNAQLDQDPSLNSFPNSAKAEPREDKVRRYLETLSQECRREIALVNNLLTLQEAVVQLPAPAFSCIFLQEWLNHFLSPFRQRFQKQNLTFQVEKSHAPTCIMSDLIRIEKILHELLTNAFKFTPNGNAVSLSIAQQDNMLSIVVLNESEPIPEEELPQLFTIFHRVPNVDPWKNGGTGIGLALVKKLTETIGGQITVNTGSFGNAFSLHLPQPDIRC
ncbi:MAG: HAMP domain-containing histidine kinase [Merismopedia sp. SIO2A8]|nr:HAMP domain-containing histidine kinase [Merismopedia sp. SIO2A8]